LGRPASRLLIDLRRWAVHYGPGTTAPGLWHLESLHHHPPPGAITWWRPVQRGYILGTHAPQGAAVAALSAPEYPGVTRHVWLAGRLLYRHALA